MTPKKACSVGVLIFALLTAFFTASPKGTASIGIPWEWGLFFSKTTYILVSYLYYPDPLWDAYENYTSEYMGAFFRIGAGIGMGGGETGISYSH